MKDYSVTSSEDHSLKIYNYMAEWEKEYRVTREMGQRKNKGGMCHREKDMGL